MIQATGSDTGKTTVVAGLCRLFANRGLKVAPVKAQNMSLNSYVTADGGEIARATAVQAAGRQQEPNVHMNPLLLKPKADDVAQLIVHGEPLRDVSAAIRRAGGPAAAQAGSDHRVDGNISGRATT